MRGARHVSERCEQSGSTSDVRRFAGGARVAVFFFNDTATTEIYTLSLHDALPI